LTGETVLEPAEGVLGSFRVRIVRREEEELLAGLFDQPGHRLGREWSEPHLPANVVRRFQWQLREQRLAFLERRLCDVDSAHQRGNPQSSLFDHAAHQSREFLEHAVEDHGRDEHLGRIVQDHVVLGTNVLTAPEKVGRLGSPVLMEARPQRTPAPADVQREGHRRVL
jgi:hypothetical protein